MYSIFNNAHNQKGLTLFELLITLAIASILLTVVGPNIQGFIYRNQIVADINDTSNALQYARFAAVDTQNDTVVCPSSASSDFKTCVTSNWNLGKIVFNDTNNNGDRDSDEELLFTTEGGGDSSVITGPNTVIEFDSTGALSNNNSVSILICPSNKDKKLARQIDVGANGRIRLSDDGNGDGVHEDANGDQLSCS